MKMPDLSFLLGAWNGGNKAETPAIFSLIRSPFVEWREGNNASPPAPPRRGRGVISHGNGGSCLRVTLGW